MSNNKILEVVNREDTKRVVVHATGFADYPYNAMFYTASGTAWCYSGYGKFCETLDEAKAYAVKAVA